MALGSEMTPADIAAVTGNNNYGWGNDSASWIIILFLFIFMGWGGRGFRLQQAGKPYAAAEQYVVYTALRHEPAADRYFGH